MNTQELPANKIYYAIGEVSRMTDVSITTLRLWEKEFDVIRPKKNRKGDRFFTVQDIENIKTIRHLVKERGYTLEGAQRIMASEFKSARSKQEAIETLKSIRNFLAGLRDAIDQRGNKPAQVQAVSHHVRRIEGAETLELFGNNEDENEA
jgi:DNA-binding transcriptional MerR regulator